MAFNFHPVNKERTKIHREPHIALSSQRISFPNPEILKALGDPAYLAVHIDEANQAIKLIPSPSRIKNQAWTVLRDKRRDGVFDSPYINVKLKLPRGYYKPLGGGVFIFDKPKGKKVSETIRTESPAE